MWQNPSAPQVAVAPCGTVQVALFTAGGEVHAVAVIVPAELQLLAPTAPDVVALSVQVPDTHELLKIVVLPSGVAPAGSEESPPPR